jgi:hypothetical protein
MRVFRPTLSPLLVLALFAAALSPLAAQQPTTAESVSLDDLKAGQEGVVWTVFQGTRPEPFKVEVTGVVRNALGPGKSLILCQMTDPRVEKMGAVAGMSGSPLYVGGKFAGALSYQLTSFETTHFAGFTPAADLAEVGARVDDAPAALAGERTPAGPAGYAALQPVFTLSGLSPAAAELMQPFFRAQGLSTTALGGSADAGPAKAGPPAALQPGDAVSVALATGDITLAGTGTVSRVDGNRVIAFGHPMASLGQTELPMCSAEIVTIIPSAMESIKVANTGPIIGTITQDRLSAVSGVLGRPPALIDVEVAVHSDHPHTLHFQVVREQQLTPMIIAAGVTEAIVGSNDAGLSNGFRISSNLVFAPGQTLDAHLLYAGPQAFALGLNDFVHDLAQDLQNPYEKIFPSRVAFSVEALPDNPAITIDEFRLSRSRARAGDAVQAQLAWRDFQGAEHREVIAIPIDPAWTGKNLEVVLAPGEALDQLTGRPRVIGAAQLRSFEAYLAAMRDDRPNDGVCVAVLEAASLFSDQTSTTPELPGSLARIAAAADEARFQQHPAYVSLWERHYLPGKLTGMVVRRPLQVPN